jgi:hypothetical protein
MDTEQIIKKKNLVVFRKLVETGVLDTTAKVGDKAPIFWAIEVKAEGIFEYLLKKESEKQLSLTYKYEENSEGQGCYYSLLDYALKFHRCLFVQRLFYYDTTLGDTQDKWGDTPLTKAIYVGDLPNVRCLIPISNLDATDKYGNTPLEKALWEGRVITVYELFKDCRIDKNTNVIKDGYTAFTKVLLMFHNENPHAPLMLAALKKMCVDPNSVDDRDESPVSLLANGLLYDETVTDSLGSYMKSNDCGDYSTLPELTDWFNEQGIKA